MPIREYQCSECGKVVEQLELEEKGPPDKCPSCGFWHSMQLKVSSFGFSLLGDGWAADGYR